MKKWLYEKALAFIIKQHREWLSTNGKKGIRLSFRTRYIPQADFAKAHLGNADFYEAELGSASFKQAHIQKATFEEADMGFARFFRTDFFKADMTEARLRGVRLNIHVNNRQKDDLEAMQKQAEKLWDHVESIAGPAQHDLRCFLVNNHIRRPRDTSSLHVN